MAALAGVATVALLAGCGEDVPSFADGGGGLVTLAPIVTDPPATTATTVAETSPPTTAAATTTTLYIDPADGCVRYYEFKIETEDEDALDLWRELDEDAAALQAECERLSVEEPDQVAAFVDEQRAIDAYLAAVAASESTATTSD
jgi:hypothetical protein